MELLLKSAVFVGVFVVLLFCQVARCEDFPDSRRQRDTPLITNKLRIVTIQHLPYTNISQGPNGLEYEGFIPDLVYALSEKLHFTYEFYKSPDGKWGSKQENGQWNGMIGELIKNENPSDPSQHQGADIAATSLVITGTRQESVDFMHPFHHLGLTVLVQKSNVMDNSTTDTWPFDFSILRPLAPSVWGSLCIITIGVGLLMSAVNQYDPYEWGGRYKLGLATEEQMESFSIPGSLWFVFSTIQWQGFERAPRSIAAKILTCFWFAFVTLTLVTYIGSLVNHLWWSSMALRHSPTKHEIYDLEDLVIGHGKDYKYGTIRGSATYRYITDVAALQKDEFLAIKHYWETEEGQSQLVTNTKDALHKVRTEKYAFLMETISAKWEMNRRPCDLTTIGEQFGARSYGFAVPKRWPYLDQFHRAIMELTEEGVIDQLEERWWVGRGECWSQKQNEKVLNKASALYMNQAKPKVVNMSLFWGQLVVMVIGVVLTLIAAAAEFLYYRYKGKYMVSNRPQDEPLKMEQTGSIENIVYQP